MDCKFTPNLGCEENDIKRMDGCRRCGWNPEVAKCRAERVKAEREQLRKTTAEAVKPKK